MGRPPRKVYYVGLERGRPAGLKKTREQLARVKRLVCGLALPARLGGGPLVWRDFDDPRDETTLFRRILADRRARGRVGGGGRAGGRRAGGGALGLAPCAAVTAEGGRAVRLEFFELVEFRAAALEHEALAPSLPGAPAVPAVPAGRAG